MKMNIGDVEQPIARAWRLDPTRSVPKVIGDEVRAHGSCCISRPEIARRAGVCKSSVDKWLASLVEHGMIRIEERASGSIPSVINITSRTWLDTIDR